MYSTLLTLHSFVRWLVLACLVLAIYRSFRGWFSQRAFSKFDNSVRHGSAAVAQLQFLLGLLLYFVSPIVDYFFANFSEAVHNREIRFFGMEHSLMMFIAVAVISTGSIRVKNKVGDTLKFKMMAIWYSIALIIIFFSIPWGFSPLVSRPYFRFF